MRVSKSDLRPTKVHRIRSSSKRMVSLFFMKSGLIECIPFEPGDTVNASWYVNVYLPHVFRAVSKWRKKIGLRGLILHDDNAKPHRVLITNGLLAENHIHPNPPYSPDLSPCDFFLFTKLKNQLRGIEFNDDNMMLNALEQAIGTLTKDDFKNCFNDWFIRIDKCIQANGQYFEKIH